MQNNILTGVALAALLIGAAGAASAADKIVIGAATAQTGALAPFDGPVVEGFDLAVEEINAAGGIDGKIKIEVVAKDVRSDPAQTSIVSSGR